MKTDVRDDVSLTPAIGITRVSRTGGIYLMASYLQRAKIVSENFKRANVSRCNFISLNRHKIAKLMIFWPTSKILSVLPHFYITISFSNLIHCTALQLPGTAVFPSSLTSSSGLIKSRIIFPSSSLLANHLWHGNSTVSPVLESSMITYKKGTQALMKSPSSLG